MIIKMTNKFKKACMISLVGLLSIPLMSQNKLVLEDVPAVNPNSLVGFEFDLYGEEQIPVISLIYDTNHDGAEDARFIYSISPYSETVVGTDNLLSYMFDWNRNGVYEEREQYKK